MTFMAWIRANSALCTLLESSLWFLRTLGIFLEVLKAEWQEYMNLKIKFKKKVLKSSNYLFLVGIYLQQLDTLYNKILNQADDGDEWCPKQTFLDFIIILFFITFVFSLFSFVPKTNLFNFGPGNYAYMQEFLLKDHLGSC